MAKGRKTGGRKVGSRNKATRDIREAFDRFVKANLSRMQLQFDELCGEDPAKALDFLAKLAEFCIPKLARTELAGDKDHPIRVAGLIEFVHADSGQSAPSGES